MPTPTPEFAKLAEKKAKLFRNAINAQETKAFCRKAAIASFSSMDESVAKTLSNWMESGAGRWLIAHGRASRVEAAQLRQGDPDWAKAAAASEEGLWRIELDENLRRRLEHVGDFVRAWSEQSERERKNRLKKEGVEDSGPAQAPRQLNKLSFEQAIKNTADEDRRISQQQAVEEDVQGIEETLAFARGELAGWRWVRVFSQQALNREGFLMKHCVGSYAERVAAEKTTIYSLRDPQNHPWATIEAAPLKEEIEARAKNEGWADSRLQAALKAEQLVEFKQVRAAYNQSPDEKGWLAARLLANALAEKGTVAAVVENNKDWRPAGLYQSPEDAFPRSIKDFSGDLTELPELKAKASDLARLPAGFKIGSLFLVESDGEELLPAGLEVGELIVGERVRALDARKWSVNRVEIRAPRHTGSRLAFGDIDTLSVQRPTWSDRDAGEKGFWAAQEPFASLSIQSAKNVNLDWIRAQNVSASAVGQLLMRGADVAAMEAIASGEIDFCGSRIKQLRVDGRFSAPRASIGLQVGGQRAEPREAGQALDALTEIDQDQESENFGKHTLDLLAQAAQAETSKRKKSLAGASRQDQAREGENIAALSLVKTMAQTAVDAGFSHCLAVSGGFDASAPAIAQAGHLSAASLSTLRLMSQAAEGRVFEVMRQAREALELLRAGNQPDEAQGAAFDKLAPAALWHKLKNPQNSKEEAIWREFAKTEQPNALDRLLATPEEEERAAQIERDQEAGSFRDERNGKVSCHWLDGTAPENEANWACRIALLILSFGAEPDIAWKSAQELLPLISALRDLESSKNSEKEPLLVNFEVLFPKTASARAEHAKASRSLAELMAEHFEWFMRQSIEEGKIAQESARKTLFEELGAVWGKSPDLSGAGTGVFAAWAKNEADQAAAAALLTPPGRANETEESFSEEEMFDVLKARLPRPDKMRAAIGMCAKKCAVEMVQQTRESIQRLAAKQEAGERGEISTQTPKWLVQCTDIVLLSSFLEKESGMNRFILLADVFALECVRELSRIADASERNAAAAHLFEKEDSDGRALDWENAAREAERWGDKRIGALDAAQIAREFLLLSMGVRKKWAQEAVINFGGNMSQREQRSLTESLAFCGAQKISTKIHRHGA